MIDYAILDALVTALAGLTGLHAYHVPEPEMVSPAVFPLFDQPYNVDWGSEDGGNSGPIDGQLMVVTTWVKGIGRAGAKTLGDYTVDHGDKSISQLLHGSDLGGAVSSIRVKGVKRAELVTFPDGRSYLACPIDVKIFPL